MQVLARDMCDDEKRNCITDTGYGGRGWQGSTHCHTQHLLIGVWASPRGTTQHEYNIYF